MNRSNITEEQQEEIDRISIIQSLNDSFLFLQSEILKEKTEEVIDNIKRNIDHISQVVQSEYYCEYISDIDKYNDIISRANSFIQNI